MRWWDPDFAHNYANDLIAFFDNSIKLVTLSIQIETSILVGDFCPLLHKYIVVGIAMRCE